MAWPVKSTVREFLPAKVFEPVEPKVTLAYLKSATKEAKKQTVRGIAKDELDIFF